MSYLTSKAMQTTAIGTVANSLPENRVILITLLNSSRYIPYTDLQKFYGITLKKAHINADGSEICSMQTTGHSFTHAIAVFLFNSRQIYASENDLCGNFTAHYLHYTMRHYIFAT